LADTVNRGAAGGEFRDRVPPTEQSAKKDYQVPNGTSGGGMGKRFPKKLDSLEKGGGTKPLREGEVKTRVMRVKVS